MIIDGPVVQLDGANVLMLDVDGSNVKVAGLAMIDARYPSTLAADPVAVLIARSSEVTAFVNQAR